MTKEELLSQLDDDQRAAVTAPIHGNHLCIANAGSGKTRVLTYRIAYLIQQGVPSSSFMMLTFTNKAANEMMSRIRALTNDDNLHIMGGTFHSVASKLLRKYGRMIGLNPRYDILNATDADSLMGVCREEFCAENGYSRDDFPKSKKDLADFYSYCRNSLMTLETGNFQLDFMQPSLFAQLATELYPAYERRKKKMNALDFDDLLWYWNQLLDVPQFREDMHHYYPNLFVDEYQDINALQDSIIRKMNQDVNQLFVVGDEAQCIYGFRGSEMQFITDFQKSFPHADVYPIHNNYRSMKGIVNLAVNMLNQSPYYAAQKKNMIATQDNGMIPKSYHVWDDYAQASAMYGDIDRAHKCGIPYSEIAVLCRTRRMAMSIEARLAGMKLPTRIDCGIGFYERVHIRTVVDFLRFVNNRKNEMSFWSVMETVQGIGPVTARKIFATFGANGCYLEDLLSVKVPKRSAQGLVHVTNAMIRASKTSDLVEQMKYFLNGYYLDRMEDLFPEDWSKRKADFKTLEEALLLCNGVEEFLDNAALTAGKDAGKEESVLITTVHRSKGLEWDKVLLPYVNDGAFPHVFSQDTEAEVEEERRLFYVAMTRARKELSLYQVNWSELKSVGGGSPFMDGVEGDVRNEEVVTGICQPVWGYAR